MRNIIFIFFIFSSISFGVKADMTKREAVGMAAHAVAKSGRANIIDGCASLTAYKELVECIAKQTLMEESISKLNDNDSVKGIIDFGYWDVSGDCALAVSVDASIKKVISIESWVCD